MSRSWWSVWGWFGRLKPMRSAGTRRVPWCSSWKKACWPLVPGSPQITGPVSQADGLAVAGDRLAVALHVELLEVGREAGQLLAVGEHGVGLGVPEVRVPDAEEAQQHRGVGLDRGGAEVLVDEVEAGEEVGEGVGADAEHEGQADGGVDRVAATDPVPEAEDVVGVDAEGRDLVEVGRQGDEVVLDRVLAEGVDQPGPGRPGVGHRLEGGEGLGGDDDQGPGGVEAPQVPVAGRRRRCWTRSGGPGRGRRRRRGRPRPSPARGRSRRCRC